MSTTVNFITYIKPKPENVTQVIELLDKVIPPSRQEPGCLQYEAFKTTNPPTYFLVHQCWQDQAALEQHMQEPHTRAFRDTLKAIGAVLDTQPLTNYDEK